MLSGLVKNTGPTLNVPVPDSKDRNSETQGKNFSDVLDSKSERATKKEDIVKGQPDKAQTQNNSVRSQKTENKGRVESQEDSENQTESPPDPKVMDPRTSATREQRDRAIRKFMDSFESEFGIPPEEMVEAMSQLTAQDLDKPPEKTVDTLIANLDLDSQDEAEAKKMYMGLVVELKQIDTRVALPRAHDDMLSQLSAQRFQLSADKKEMIGSQVQGLSDKFWMRGAQAEKTMTPEVNQLQVREFLNKMITAESAGIELDQAEAVSPEMMSSTENLLKQLKSEKLNEFSKEDSSDLSLEGETSFMAESSGMKALTQNLKSQGSNADNQQDQEQANLGQEVPLSKPAISQEAVQAEFKRLGIKPIEQMQTKKLVKADVEAMLSLDAGSMSQVKIDTSNSILPTLSLQPTVDLSPVQKTENIQQIMNQAQILLKDGGGEVKVEMTPEGMGSIQMKLRVLDGKVQLQMNTETKEAKKMIESSMNDLKQSLAAHQLSMDLVKVDVVHQASSSQNTQNDLQNQMQNFMNHQQRDGTKQFWQQFNENFGNRQAREAFIDAQNIKSPVKNQTLPGFDATSSNSRARTDGRGKSLNLVA